MRKVVSYHLLSVDGVAEEPSNWVFAFDEQCRANLARIIGAQDAVLLGRHMYDEWAAYWPTATDEPFASFINRVAKYVFTAGTPALEWNNSTVVATDAATYVGALKQQPGADIGIHGSIELTRSLLAAHLVDEIRLLVTPTIAGHGTKLFDDDREVQRLELITCEATSSGALLVGYRIVRP